MLVMDGHGSHFTLDLLAYCRHIGLRGLLRPPHTTHILQREDSVHFSMIKDLYHQSKMLHLGKKLLTRKYPLGEGDLVDVAREAWRTALSQETACRG